MDHRVVNGGMVPFLPTRFLWALLLLAGTAQGLHAQIFKLPLPDTTAGNFFGVDVAIDGRRALIGASGEPTCGANSGAAYLYEQDEADRWHLSARLSASDCTAESFFGRAVALSGRHALVTAYRPFFGTIRPNAVYIFAHDASTGTWHEAARLTVQSSETEGSFGLCASLDGSRALVTTSGDTDRGRYGGAAYVFEPDPASGKWRQTARLTGNGNVKDGIFGTSCVLEGDRVVVTASTYGANRPGSAYVFERDPARGTWSQTAHLRNLRDYFIPVDLDGDRLLVGQSRGGPGQSGLATLYERDIVTGHWHLADTLQSGFPYRKGAFGSAVSLKGNRALVVGYDEQLSLNFNVDRVVYVFAFDPGTRRWTQQRILDVGDVWFGSAVDLDQNVALIGQASEQRPGQAYIVSIN